MKASMMTTTTTTTTTTLLTSMVHGLLVLETLRVGELSKGSTWSLSCGRGPSWGSNSFMNRGISTASRCGLKFLRWACLFGVCWQIDESWKTFWHNHLAKEISRSAKPWPSLLTYST
jgi:hypothetical protein